jgi:hypothetical protein
MEAGIVFSINGNRESNDLDHLAFAIVGFFDHISVDAFHGNHGLAQVARESCFRSVQLRRVALPRRIGEAESTSRKL